MATTDQIPTNSGFHAKSTGSDVLAGIDLAGRTAIVTGGYSGLGLETVRGLAEHGATVIVPVRSPQKAKENLAGIAGDIRASAMDLADLASVRRFGESMVAELAKLDLLITNAGIMACPESRVGPGWEMQLGVNHLGHFALTKLLLPLLERTPGARVVALSSGAHKRSDIRWDDPHFEREPYDKWAAYGQSKTANALFANALSRRLTAHGGLAFSLHPGGILTPLQRHLPKEEMIALGWIDEDGNLAEAVKDAFKTPQQGCATTLWAATSPLLEGKPGVYCEDCDIAAPTDLSNPAGRFVGVDPHACDDDAAERLWALSEEWIAAA